MRPMIVCLSLLFVAVSLISADSEPGEAIRARASADAEKLLPQTGPGGSDTAHLDAVEAVHRSFAVEVEGCEKCRAHLAIQAGMNRSRKHALVVAVTGGYDLEQHMQAVSRMSGGHDPLVFCSLMYTQARNVSDDPDVEIVMYENIIEDDKIAEAFAWLLEKVKKEQPIDPDRIFLFGMDSGASEALDVASRLWEKDPDKFPFRAVLLEGLHFMPHRMNLPPVPYVFSYERGTVIRGGQGSARLANNLLAQGIPVQFHTYGGSGLRIGSALPSRMLMIHRDAIAGMGGPGAPSYPPERPMPGVITDADKVPFADSEDRYVREVVNLARQEMWVRAKQHMENVLDNRNINARDKRELRNFQREFDRWAKSEMERCNRSVEVSLNADMWPHHLHLSRLKALVEAYKDDRWLQGKPFAANLEKVRTFGPAQRDAERREIMMKALRTEMEGDRQEARKLYEELAARKNEDGGFSDWPFAAEYRLSWWTD
jgi:predicted esterase